MRSHYDVIVVGGGTAGITAAIQAGRAGSSTLLVEKNGMGINWRALKQDVLPTIPRGALLPANSRFLLVAGRCLASDRDANSALRVECPCMAMGQAAGALAALSVRTAIDPEELPIKDVRTLLAKHGAIVPGDDRVSADSAPGD